MNNQSIFDQGTNFFVGANYWASHAGTQMWSNWREDVVEKDFQTLATNGVEVLRVFPRWDDFQPVKKHERNCSIFVEMRLDEESLPDTPLGRAGINPVMIERFRCLCNLAQKHNLKLIVGIITGWMSGRIHKPQAFNNINVISDPMAIKWQVRFVRAFVKELKNESSIYAWDLGNECDCMEKWDDSSTMWNWCNTISSAIKREDSYRPVVSGMHGLKVVDNGGRCSVIEEHAEILDVLCTHPYPCFTPHCKVDPIDTIRNAFHAAVETQLLSNIGNVPAFVEEAGSLGPGCSSEAVAANYLHNMLWNCYAHDCRGLLWWCAHEQTELPQTPYDWVAMERALGLLRLDHSPKPVMNVLREFGKMSHNLKLPKYRKNGVCILTAGQDHWGVAYMTMLLAKQAGFDIEFQYAEQPLKKSDFYLIPSVQGHGPISRHRWHNIMEAVEKEGATLYISSNDCTIEPFYGNWSNIVLERVYKATDPQVVTGDNFQFTCNAPWQQEISTKSGKVLASDQYGNPVLVETQCGSGRILYSTAPIEATICEQPGAFLKDYYKLYQIIAHIANVERAVIRNNPMLTLTEHFESDDSMLLCVVNNTPKTLSDTLVAKNWKFTNFVAGIPQTSLNIVMQGNSGTIIKLQKYPK